MIVVLKSGASSASVEGFLRDLGIREDQSPRVCRVGGRAVLRAPELANGLNGYLQTLRDHPDVERVLEKDSPFLFASRDLHPEPTLVSVGSAVFGGEKLVLAAGPCTVEGRDLLRRSAEAAREAGATLLRGGAYKPRTSPYAFQGMGEPGLELLSEVGEEFGLAVVTEVMSPADVDLVAAHASMLQIGSRSMQNFPLLDAVGRQRKPVLLKRGLMATIDEFLAAAEYVLSRGNENVVLCERGIRSFDPRTRNTLDLVAVPVLRELTHLPIIVDPSHSTGRRELVRPASLAAIAAGADGLLIEVHPEPHVALCDGPQALLPADLQDLAIAIAAVARAVGRSF